ncbi:MAG: AarF/UbiB family protein, partial [Planctomycetota bacterium]|nr:AarF/UbiB family protein [Planctomycetota bacterium]
IEAVRAQIERELGAPAEEVFAEFSWEPLAAASIAQVHRARLRTGAEVVVKFGFDAGERKTLCWQETDASTTDLQPVEMPLADGGCLGAPGRDLRIPAPAVENQWLAGPFAGLADFPFTSRIFCEKEFISATLRRLNDGPLFTDYELRYAFAEHRHYTLRFRCYKSDPYIEVAEHYALRMNSRLVWALNPASRFDSIVSREWFQSENQPLVEPLRKERTRDVLCRLQMPVLCEYFIPNNRGWFALFSQRHPSQPMLGILGLYGRKWEMPVEGMPEIFGCGGTVEWHASLASGRRHWLFYTGPVETEFTPSRRLVFHRLHAEFNALRLDEHLDLAGDKVFDETCWREGGIFVGDDFHAQARQRYEALPCLRKCLESPDNWLQQNGSLHLAIFAYLLEPTPERRRLVYDK